MKELFIVRHAKSDWSIEGIPDIDRPLNARGYNDAHKIGKHLRESEIFPMAMISSPAIRAISTALIISDETGFFKHQIRIEPMLYETGINEYLKVMHSVDDNIDSVALFGHNTVLSELCSVLAGQPIEMPTCAVARFTLLTATWNSVSTENVEFIELITPKTIISGLNTY